MKKFLLLTLALITCSLSIFADDARLAVMPEPTPENPNPQMPEAPPGYVIAQ